MGVGSQGGHTGTEGGKAQHYKVGAGDNGGDIDDGDGGEREEKNDIVPAVEYARQRRRGVVLSGQ